MGNAATDDAGKERWPSDEGGRGCTGVHGGGGGDKLERSTLGGFQRTRLVAQGFQTCCFIGGKKKEVRHPEITLVEGNVLSPG